jgi:transcription elongation factor GreB
MSKAFVNEDAETDDDLADDVDGEENEATPGIPKGAKNYITHKGQERLKAELHELIAVERPKLVETVAWAASNGDRSENADYIYGKRRLREIDRRMRFLTKRLDIAEVVDPNQQKGEKVLFGATVTVLDEHDNERVYKIVGVDETDAKAGKVSWISPVGQALLQATVGDVVTLKTPKGEEDLEVLKVQFIAID